MREPFSTMNELVGLSAGDLAAQIKGRAISPVEAVAAVLERVDEVDPMVHAMVTVDTDGALEAARRAESALSSAGPLGPLHGVPVTVKDLVATRGIRTMLGSPAYRSWVPGADAPAVTLLRQAGAIIIGKTATPEFGHKAVTDGPVGEPTRNPWNLDLTAGGSSGGAAAALAAGIGPIAVGTDGGGSIRIPAALCGVVGVKPTAGSVPTYPPSLIGALGHTGPMARTVVDAALLLGVMQGSGDRADQLARSVGNAAAGDLRGLRVGVFRTIDGLPIELEILDAVDRTVDAAESRGAVVGSVALPCDGADEIWDALFDRGMLAQASLLPDDAAETFSPSLAEVLANARRRSPGEAELAEARRAALAQRMHALFDRYDVLLGPTVAVPAFPLGLNGPAAIAGTPVDERAWWRIPQLWNLSGEPACSLPCGFTREGLPIGIQLVAPLWHDHRLLHCAAVLETALAPSRLASLQPSPAGGS
jgi:aspartyl-tRNA(Asn)/glutamyl-tRNA(Gln) amidotransferase subunit A